MCVQSKLTYTNAVDLQPHLGVKRDEEYLDRVTAAPVFHPEKDLVKNYVRLAKNAHV